MADKETEAEWAKSKRIEEERLKAEKALLEEKNSKANLAYLDPKGPKKRGFSKDPDAVLGSAEKFSEKSVILIVLGVALYIIGMAGGNISQMGSLGMGAVIISGIPSGVGSIMIVVAAFLAVVSLAVCLIFCRKTKRKIFNAVWPAVTTLAILAICLVVRNMI